MFSRISSSSRARLLSSSTRSFSAKLFKDGSHLAPAQEGNIDFSKLITERAAGYGLKTIPEPEKLDFGAQFSDHLLEIDWIRGQGWFPPQIRPYGPFLIDPAANVLHYAMEAFEGLKAYNDEEGNVRMFRPEMNVKRMQSSFKALAFPEFDGDQFLECMRELIRVDRRWIPKGRGYSLYVRPTVISTDPRVKVMPSSRIKLFVILSPVGPYYSGGFVPVRLLADDEHVRAWRGGCGAYKLGSNYGPTILPAQMAAAKGFDQILWLYGDEKYVTEVGTMNQFFYWINEDGEKELITAPLSQEVILPGVTRDSILKLARGWGDCKVTERPFTIAEVTKAVADGRMLEAFGAGTAAIVSPVKSITYQGKEHAIPCGEKGDIGPMAKKFADTLMGIQYGEIDHEWSEIIAGPEA